MASALNVVAALRRLATLSGNAQSIAAKGVLPLLGQLARSSDEELRVGVLRALLALAVSHEDTRSLLDMGLLDSAVVVLADGEPESRTLSAQLLEVASRDHLEFVLGVPGVISGVLAFHADDPFCAEELLIAWVRTSCEPALTVLADTGNVNAQPDPHSTVTVTAALSQPRPLHPRIHRNSSRRRTAGRAARLHASQAAVPTQSIGPRTAAAPAR